MVITIETARLVLRPFVAGDGPALYGYLSQPDAVRFEPYGIHSSVEATAAAVARASDPAFVAVCDAVSGGLLGNLYVAPEGPLAWRTWQIGYVFDPRHWGNGYATEACTALVEDLVTTRGAHRVVARCDTRNRASWALLERLGMRREGWFREAASFDVDGGGEQVWHDAFAYALLADEWFGDSSARG